jgi:hypothetical protein
MADLKKVFFVLTFKKKPRVYIETGTYNGDNLSQRVNKYNLLYSIEINPEFHAINMQKFKPIAKINLFEGDSSEILPLILNVVSEPCVIFLDAHYSGKKALDAVPSNPLIKELRAISRHNFNSFVIIDDTRLIGKKQMEGLPGDPLYPLFEADWSEVTMDHILETIPKNNSIFENKYGSLTTGRSDQLIIANVNVISKICLNIYIYLVYPIFYHCYLKLYRKILKSLRAQAHIHGILRKIKRFVLKFI